MSQLACPIQQNADVDSRMSRTHRNKNASTQSGFFIKHLLHTNSAECGNHNGCPVSLGNETVQRDLNSILSHSKDSQLHEHLVKSTLCQSDTIAYLLYLMRNADALKANMSSKETFCHPLSINLGTIPSTLNHVLPKLKSSAATFIPDVGTEEVAEETMASSHVKSPTPHPVSTESRGTTVCSHENSLNGLLTFMMSHSATGYASIPVFSKESSFKHCRRRKARTVFSDHQLMGLEHRFEVQHYLSTPERVELANQLNLSETQVKTWFQNRRMKDKKMKRSFVRSVNGTHSNKLASNIGYVGCTSHSTCSEEEDARYRHDENCSNCLEDGHLGVPIITVSHRAESNATDFDGTQHNPASTESCTVDTESHSVSSISMPNLNTFAHYAADVRSSLKECLVRNESGLNEPFVATRRHLLLHGCNETITGLESDSLNACTRDDKLTVQFYPLKAPRFPWNNAGPELTKLGG